MAASAKRNAKRRGAPVLEKVETPAAVAGRLNRKDTPILRSLRGLLKRRRSKTTKGAGPKA
jgi:hypothetical protein